MPIALPKELTSGQQEPLPELLQPYEKFPTKISGPTVWRAEDFRSRPDLWQRQWTPELIQQLEEAFDKFEVTGKTLPDNNKDTFPLPADIVDFLSSIREDVVNGQGFILIEGLPVTEWTWETTPLKSTKFGSIPDVVGLLCLHKAMEGGESDVVSAHNLWNTLQAERPDVAELLTKPDWYFDRKGEVSDGQKPWVQKAVFYFHDGRVISHFDPYFVKSIGRHVEAGLIPGHSEEQLEAIAVLEQTAQRLALHMILKVGDIQFVADAHVLHARTAYRDHLPPAPRRHLLRLWLATPESQGGWKRPFPDSANEKRGGIQVNDQAETCPLDAE
ncbi:hypothetical protein QFC21_006023 [Naganishia friedmannii]|uniref:Uncharacterized protein n=1 Tax=Naganishia friedmannii TaxID=89922 RepID=A0ACC2V664_9TREE|nr:hypothetical protein QFC21_006023 [Naganishia friedmannii]